MKNKKLFSFFKRGDRKTQIGKKSSVNAEDLNRENFPGKNSENELIPDKNLVALLSPYSFEAEQFRILRTQILFPSSGTPPRTILVTSAIPDEGKSFVSSNLAICIAHNIDNHVLLMDCDIRRPSIHKIFGFPQDVRGLSEYLSGDEPLSSMLLKTMTKNLSVLPGGQPPPNPSELLSSEKMSHLLSSIKKRYNDRYIIIDSPPPQLTAETSVIARQVDGILLVVRHGRTSKKLVAELVETLGKEKILGVVFNCFDMHISSYNSRRYSKYYQKGRK